MNTQALVTVGSFFIAIISVIVAIVTLWNNKHKDVRNETKAETKEQVEAHAGLQAQIDTVNAVQIARLDAIDNGIRDLKAERRVDSQNVQKRFDELREDMRDIHDEAMHARELAEAAHRRLDRAGIEQDPRVQVANERG